MIRVLLFVSGVAASLAPARAAELWAMGRNEYGEAGDETTTKCPIPVFVCDDVEVIASGGGHTALIRSDGSLWMMGLNAEGQLGDGTTSNRLRPVRVAEDVVHVAAGSSHTLFIKTDGSLWGMGSNSNGNLGDGTATNRLLPVHIAGEVVQVAAGEGHSLFIKTDGTLWGMGKNSSGQLGDGTRLRKTAPALIASNVVQVAAGYSHTGFVKADGTLWMTGWNFSGQLGTGDTASPSFPVQVASGVARVSAGYGHTLVQLVDGTAVAFGNNDYGQLGDGTRSSRATFGNAIPVPSVSQMACGFSHSLILSTDGTLWAAGSNADGQLGLSGVHNRVVPSLVLDRVLDVQTYGNTSVLLRASEPPRLFTQPTEVLTGVGREADLRVVPASDLPVTYQWFEGESGDTSHPIAGETRELLSVRGDAGNGRYWVRVTNRAGHVDGARIRLTVVAPPTVRAQPLDTTIRYGETASLAVEAEGAALRYQWYRGASGDLSHPVVRATRARFTTRGLKSDEDYWVRVSNAAGHIDSRSVRVAVEPLQRRLTGYDVITTGQIFHPPAGLRLEHRCRAIAAGRVHSAAVRDDGIVVAWGENTRGQLRVPSDLSDAIDVVAGDTYTLALRRDGTVRGWGAGDYGELTPPAGLADLVSIDAGLQHVIGLRGCQKRFVCVRKSCTFDHRAMRSSGWGQTKQFDIQAI